MAGQDSSHRATRDQPAQTQLVRALVWVATRVVPGAAVTSVATGLATRSPEPVIVAVLLAVNAAIGFRAKRAGSTNAGPLLASNVAVCATVGPVASPVALVAILPALTLFAFAGVFTLGRRAALRLNLWCGVAAVWSVLWLMPGLTRVDLVKVTLVLSTIGVAAWRMLTLAGDVMVREEDSHRFVLDSSPVAIMECDYSGVAQRLDVLRQDGVEDLRLHLSLHPDETKHLVSLVAIWRANPAALHMLGAPTVDLLDAVLPDLFDADNTDMRVLLEPLFAIWERRWTLAFDLDGQTLAGRRLEGVLHWAVPECDGEPDLGRVIVTISDIAPRKVVEERLAEAVEMNQRMVAFERALGHCSRALVLGNGDRAINEALESFRDATGSDCAYLATNIVEAGNQIGSMIVNSVNRADLHSDDGVGLVVRWTEYPTAREVMASGRTFQYIAADAEPHRSLLSVPIFSDGQWVASIGLVDLDRTTPWDDEAVHLLEVAAPMISTVWERNTTREELRLAQEKLNQASRLEAIGSLAAGIAHEINTPMQYIGDNATFLRGAFGRIDEIVAGVGALEAPFDVGRLAEVENIRGRYDALRLDALRSRVPAAIEASLEGVSAVSRIVRAMKDFSHPGGETMEDIDLNRAIETTLVVSKSQWKYVADLATDLDPSNPVIRGFPGELNQVLLNVFVNAGHAIEDRQSDEMGSITVSTRKRGSVVEVSITDTGVGIPADVIDRIFDPFFTTKDVGRGTGQGLAISHQIVRSHHGTISVSSEVGVGTTFQIELPLAHGVAAA